MASRCISGICPGVSMRVNGPKAPRTLDVVVPSIGETGETYLPCSVLKRVDLPEFGRPMMATLRRISSAISSCAIFQFTEFMNLRASARFEGIPASIENENRRRGLTLNRLLFLPFSPPADVSAMLRLFLPFRPRPPSPLFQPVIARQPG